MIGRSIVKNYNIFFTIGILYFKWHILCAAIFIYIMMMISSSMIFLIFNIFILHFSLQIFSYDSCCLFVNNCIFWMLDSNWTASYEIAIIHLSLSIRLSITEFSQDWRISFFWYCTWCHSWPWYLVADKARFFDKMFGGLSSSPAGLN